MTPIEIVVGFFAALGILWWLKDAFGFSLGGWWWWDWHGWW
jgi:hypothetical protein